MIYDVCQTNGAEERRRGGYIRKHAVDSGSKVGQSGGPCGRFQRGGQAKCISPPRVQARRASQFCRTPSTLTAGLAPARSAKPRRTASPFPHSRRTPKPPPAHPYRSRTYSKPLMSKQKQRQTKPIAMRDANETNAQTGKNDRGKVGADQERRKADVDLDTVQVKAGLADGAGMRVICRRDLVDVQLVVLVLVATGGCEPGTVGGRGRMTPCKLLRELAQQARTVATSAGYTGRLPRRHRHRMCRVRSDARLRWWCRHFLQLTQSRHAVYARLRQSGCRGGTHARRTSRRGRRRGTDGCVRVGRRSGSARPMRSLICPRVG